MFVILAFLHFLVVISSNFFKMSCLLVFGGWREEEVGNQLLCAESSGGADPAGTEVELAAQGSCKLVGSWVSAPREDRDREPRLHRAPH